MADHLQELIDLVESVGGTVRLHGAPVKTAAELEAKVFESLAMRHAHMAAADEPLVRELCDRIGYGRVMQLAEQLWNEKQPGGAHSVGACVGLLVHCPCRASGRAPHRCAWCCGSGRVTKRVARAMKDVSRRRKANR